VIHWPRLIYCLLLSLGIWFIHNISQSVSDVVSVSVIAESNLSGRVSSSTDQVSVAVQCTAQAYVFLYYKIHRKPVRIQIDSEDLVLSQGDHYTISSQDFLKYWKSYFSGITSNESFLKESYSFSFPVEHFKKIPVHLVDDISYKSQYICSGVVSVTPDSVLVYGSPARLSTIDAAFTKPVSYHDLNRNVHGMVRLERIPGARISETSVSYSIGVERYVELVSRVKISRRNVPAGVRFSVYPSSADVTFHCVFPIDVNPSDPSEFFVDYNDFVTSLSGKCMIRCEGLPEGVLDWSINPEFCDCIIEEERQ